MKIDSEIENIYQENMKYQTFNYMIVEDIIGDDKDNANKYTLPYTYRQKMNNPNYSMKPLDSSIRREIKQLEVIQLKEGL